MVGEPFDVPERERNVGDSEDEGFFSPGGDFGVFAVDEDPSAEEEDPSAVTPFFAPDNNQFFPAPADSSHNSEQEAGPSDHGHRPSHEQQAPAAPTTNTSQGRPGADWAGALAAFKQPTTWPAVSSLGKAALAHPWIFREWLEGGKTLSRILQGVQSGGPVQLVELEKITPPPLCCNRLKLL